jgi:hypothetical protein
MDLSTVEARVNELLRRSSQDRIVQERNSTLQTALYQGTIGLMQALYGPDSSQEKELHAFIQWVRKVWAPGDEMGIQHCIDVIRGTLISIKAELDTGFIGSLRATLSGEILTDLIKLARTTLEESSDGAKNVASVLTAAAFEDVMRKLSDLKGLPEQERLQDVLIALKDAGVPQRTEVTTAQSYLSFRNHALHARWSEVDRPVVQSALGFTEQIILKHLT